MGFQILFQVKQLAKNLLLLCFWIFGGGGDRGFSIQISFFWDDII
jgi:hypothetical protein